MQPPAGEFPRAQTDNQRIPQKRKYSIFLNMSKDNLELKYFCVFCKKRRNWEINQSHRGNLYLGSQQFCRSGRCCCWISKSKRWQYCPWNADTDTFIWSGLLDAWGEEVRRKNIGIWKGCLKRGKNSWIQNEQRNYYMSVLYEIKNNWHKINVSIQYSQRYWKKAWAQNPRLFYVAGNSNKL